MLMPISHFEPAKHSKNGHGTIRAYSASTNQGPVREYNEDRVAIILNFTKPEHAADWKKPAYFGVFDGHGGMDCADFLRDTLHTFISKERKYSIFHTVFQTEWRRPLWQVSRNAKRRTWTNRIWEKLTNLGRAGWSLFFMGGSATLRMWAIVGPLWVRGGDSWSGSCRWITRRVTSSSRRGLLRPVAEFTSIFRDMQDKDQKCQPKLEDFLRGRGTHLYPGTAPSFSRQTISHANFRRYRG